MNQIWIVYTIITVVYIVLLVLYFWRRNRAQEKDLEAFLKHAQLQMSTHKNQVHDQANKKMHKMVTAMTILQRIINDLQIETQREYDRVIREATEEREDMLATARQQADEILQSATSDLDEYRLQRQHEIEADLVRLVINVSERVVGEVLVNESHTHLIYKSLDEVKQQKDKM